LIGRPAKALFRAAIDEQRYEVADRTLVELRPGLVGRPRDLVRCGPREGLGQPFDDLVDRAVLIRPAGGPAI
jgi:hypothetical protein